MKAAVLDGVSGLPGHVAVSFYDTKPFRFLSVCCNAIRWVQKTQLVYYPATQMVRYAQFLLLNVNDSHNYNMNPVGLCDQLRNMYRVDHCMRKYKWWWSPFFWGHGLVLVNDCIVYKTLCE